MANKSLAWRGAPLDLQAAQQAFASAADGVIRLQAPLTFATVTALRRPGVAVIEAARDALSFDLGQVAQVDSAGLALLIDWLAVAHARGCTLRYVNLSDASLALARLSEVEKLLTATGPSASPSPGSPHEPATQRD